MITHYLENAVKNETTDIDYICMGLALEQACGAASMGEVPVGAVLVDEENRVLAAAGNDCIASCDPTGHAEMRVLRDAGRKKANYRLPYTTMYVTLEPCAMCASAMIQARIRRIVFGASDPKTGGLQSVYQIGTDGRLNHRFVIQGGVRSDECSQLLKDFFRLRRGGKKP